MKILPEVSRTLSEYLLLPNLTTEDCTPANVDLGTPVVRHAVGEPSPIRIAAPLVSAIMEAVSSPRLAVALARTGGMAFIHQNQDIASQAADVAAVKGHKAGFRRAELHVVPTATLGDITALTRGSAQDFVAVTDDGTAEGSFLGLITVDDFHPDRHNPTDAVTTRMRAVEDLVTASSSVSLSDANETIWQHRLDVLPVLTSHARLASVVLRADYESHTRFRHESVDADKRFRVGAGINSRDHTDRVPALVDAGADVLCIDSSDGYSVYQARTLEFVRDKYGADVHVGAGNVVDGRAFRYLADAGAAWVKVGIGGGSICTTRETKGIGRGQASALIDVARARDAYAEQTGVYVPLCCDGGLLTDYHMAIALALGADFIMLGRYFARFDESPNRRVRIGGRLLKEYWGEGSARARNIARYEQGGDDIAFEEGVDGYVPYAGSLQGTVPITVAKLKATLISCGSTSLPAFRDSAVLVPVSEQSHRQTGAEVMVRDHSQDTGE
ncbi:IMP dehydrogenase (plasmid) [Embleya sp. NBC_00888]|uniref:IMP dehydrogenase n=1 Tax=Embleya sp. NBC_00888 TaxID=2975960 RepID=UPI002F9102B9|nr:IMP dehydrogenase [Embleya sp. NBC_00888]